MMLYIKLLKFSYLEMIKVCFNIHVVKEYNE